MPRIGLANILFGFVVIIIASFGGFFIASEADKAFLVDKALLASWQYTLFKSAHGHFNLFGMLHILMGLSMPYSRIQPRWQVYQSFCVMLGTLTMGILLVFRGYTGAPENQDFQGILIGTTLSLALFGLMMHGYGLTMKLLRK